MRGAFGGAPHCDICAASKLCERHCDADAVTQSSRNMAGALFAGFQQEVVVIFVEGLDDLLDVLKQMAPVLVLLSTTAILWWRSAHVAR